MQMLLIQQIKKQIYIASNNYVITLKSSTFIVFMG